MWDLINFVGLTANCDPPDLSLLSSQDYKCELLALNFQIFSEYKSLTY
jgi:hypothetical protein